MGLLGEIYSFGNRTRNKLRGLLDDPKGYLQQTADQTANTLRDMSGANETAQQFALRDKINAGDKNALAQYRNLEKTIQNKLFDVALNFNPAAVGMFIGKGAKTWDAAAAAEAEKRLAAGDDARKVWSELGVFRGPDGHLRQEIDDSAAKVTRTLSTLKNGGSDGFPVESLTYAKRPDGYDLSLQKVGAKTTNDFFSINAADESVVRGALPDHIANKVISGASDGPSFIGSDLFDAHQLNSRFKFDGFNALPVQNAINHNPLFNAYNLDEYVQVNPKLGIGGSLAKMDTGDSVITTGLGDQRGTLLHELQHAIQQREGWAKGGSPEQFKTDGDTLQAYWDALTRAQYGFMDAKKAGGIHPETGLSVQMYKDNMNGLSAKIDELRKTGAGLAPEEGYKRLAGEAEARATQARMNMDMAQRRATYPLDSYDVPVNQLIIRGGLLK